MKDILILGVGNLVLKDEGIGIHVINRLEKEELPLGVDLLDGGTGGIFLIGTLQQYKHLILIDATLDSRPAGTIRHLKPKYSHDYPLLLRNDRCHDFTRANSRNRFISNIGSRSQRNRNAIISESRRCNSCNYQ